MPRRHAKYICFEGMDGSGKSTQARKLAEHLKEQGYEVLPLGEPSDNPVGKKIRDMIRSKKYLKETIALAFATDRMLLKDEVLIPAFDTYDYVITDRNYLSSLVYQPLMGCDLRWIMDLNKFVVKPDLTFVFDITIETFAKRRGETEVIFETLDFQQQVRKGYRNLQRIVMDDIVFLDGEESAEELHETVKKLVKQL